MPAMSSWRDTTSEEVQTDLDRLLERILRDARRMFEERGEFHPWATRVTAGGETVNFTAMIDDDLAVAAIYDEMTEHAPQGRAIAVVSHIRRGPLSGAIQVDLEHRDGVALAVALPYSEGRGGGRDFGALTTVLTQRRVWT